MGLMDSFDIGEAGLVSTSERIKIYAENVANINTVNYSRKIPVLMTSEESSFQKMIESLGGSANNLQISGTTKKGLIVGVVKDTTPGDLVYKPGNPYADKNGYVRLSNVNAPTEIADATLASRAYEANLAVISITKAMAQRATEIGR